MRRQAARCGRLVCTKMSLRASLANARQSVVTANAATVKGVRLPLPAAQIMPLSTPAHLTVPIVSGLQPTVCSVRLSPKSDTCAWQQNILAEPQPKV